MHIFVKDSSLIKKIIKRKHKCPYVCKEFILIGFARYHINTSCSLISKLLKIIVQKSCSPSGKQTKSKVWIVDFMFVSSKHFFILKVFKFQHFRLCWLSRLRYIWDKPGMSIHSWYELGWYLANRSWSKVVPL